MVNNRIFFKNQFGIGKKTGVQSSDSVLTIDTSEPIRGSVIIMVLQLIILLVFTDLIYILINVFLMRVYYLKLTLPFDLHHKILLLLAFLHIVKSIVQIYSILVIVFRWIGRSYYIVDKKLIKRQGLFSVKEKIFDLNNIRSVTVNQSFLGKLLQFGDVVIETSASGGYMDKIILAAISNPQRFESRLRQCF